MLNKIQTSFRIQDLEVLSGIKAHTIRIWEKRYGLLKPQRLGRNIRVYSLLDLQRMLNVVLLKDQGFKVSELAKLEDSELEKLVKSNSIDRTPPSFYQKSYLVSMFTLDTSFFQETYKQQLATESFEEIFIGTFVPLLNYIGILWQSKGLIPAHEHFLSNLIYQKIAANTEDCQVRVKGEGPVNVLFLPAGEIHELGLMYLSYHLKCQGERVVYLGRDIPSEDLLAVNTQFKEINWICAFVIDRTEEEKFEFVQEIELLLKETENTCAIIGSAWSEVLSEVDHDAISFFEGFDEMIR